MVSAVTLIAVVAAVIGTVTTIAFHSYMYGKLDDQLHTIAGRAAKPPGGGDRCPAVRRGAWTRWPSSMRAGCPSAPSGPC